MNITDFASIEHEKENIKPMKMGRSAKKLAELASMDKTSLHVKLNQERRHFEETLEQRDKVLQLDDPIEPYIEYIKWIRAHYTTGNINESGLIKVLERTTHDFKEDDYYRNEIRYFKVWLEYITYSDVPGEVYKYLYKKKIGTELSIFYERYAQFYELNDQWESAEQLLNEGIQCNARPISKLRRYLQEFLERKSIKASKRILSSSKTGLSNKTGTGLSINENMAGNSGGRKSKLNVFLDTGAQKKEEISEWGFEHLDTIKNAKKENKISSSAWSGQTLKQEIKPIVKPPKLEVFEDSKRSFPITTTCVDKERNRTQIFDFNMDMFVNKGSRKEPQTMIEVMLSYYQKYKPETYKRPFLGKEKTNKRSLTHDCITPDHKKVKVHEDFQYESKLVNTPTVTLTTKQARQELMEIFDDALKPDSNDLYVQKDYDALSDGGLSDFVTETITKSLNLKEHSTGRSQVIKTPLENQQEKQLLSSPFVENPAMDSQGNRKIENHLVVDPFDPDFKNQLLDRIDFSKYSNFHISNTQNNKLKTLKSLFKPGAPSIQGNKQALIEFKPDDFHCITRQLGNSINNVVYLSEKYDGTKVTMKITSPPNQWEAYILNKINAHNSNDFINLKAFYRFNDESYLILPYKPHGSILDLINLLSEQTNFKGFKYGDEHLAVYLSIQLIKKMLKLHAMKIIHAKITPGNCLLDFAKSSNKVSFDEITLVNYSKSIDLTLLSSDIRFQSNVITDSNDTAFELLGRKLWKYEIDYFGLANVIHMILFGKTIKVSKDDQGNTKLKEEIKKYWQVDLWTEMFELLLNSKEDEPISSSKFETLIKKFESWFNLTVDRRKFLQKLQDIEEALALKSTPKK